MRWAWSHGRGQLIEWRMGSGLDRATREKTQKKLQHLLKRWLRQAMVQGSLLSTVM
jgi:hypothetical protein